MKESGREGNGTNVILKWKGAPGGGWEDGGRENEGGLTKTMQEVV